MGQERREEREEEGREEEENERSGLTSKAEKYSQEVEFAFALER